MKRALLAGVVLVSGVAVAGVFGGGGAGAVVNVLAELVGKNVNAATYSAGTTSGTAFQCTGGAAPCVRLGGGPRATIDECETGTVCIGPNDLGFGSKLYVWGDIVSQTMVARTFLDVQGSSYIINNNGPVRITDEEGITINNGTPQKGRVQASVTFDSTAIAAHDCEPQTITVAGAAINDVTTVTANFQLPKGVSLNGGRVTAVDTVELNLCNVTAGSLNPASGPFLVELVR